MAILEAMRALGMPLKDIIYGTGKCMYVSVFCVFGGDGEGCRLTFVVMNGIIKCSPSS